MKYDKYLAEKTRDPSHIIIHGDPGTGKSTLVAKLAEEGFTLWWFSTDNGHKVLEKLSPDAIARVNLFILPDTVGFPIASATMTKVLSGNRYTLCDNHGQIDCKTCKADANAFFSDVELNSLSLKDIVVVDTVKQLATSYMARIVTKAIDAMKPGDRPAYEDFKPGWEEYRTQGAAMDRDLTQIQQAKYNCICITHSLESEMEDGKKKLVPLVGTNPFSRNVGGYFDHIIYCEMFNGGHKFGSSTGYKAMVISKSRTDLKIESLEIPSLKPFFDGTIGKPHEYGSKAVTATLVTAANSMTTAQKLQALREKVGVKS